MTWKELSSKLQAFEVKLNTALDRLGISERVIGLQMDHICVRFKNTDDIESLKKSLIEFSNLISDEVVNGRNILIYKFNIPLNVNGFQVSCLELPYPKNNHNYEDWFEHIEFVLPNSKDMTALRENFKKLFDTKVIDRIIEEFSYEENIPKVEGEKIVNNTIALYVDSVGIKFHGHSIEEIVA